MKYEEIENFKMDTNEDSWVIECSDDEKYGVDSKSEWVLKAEDILNLIDGMEKNNQVLDLEWICPGKRDPSPIIMNNNQQDQLHEHKPKEQSDFDFMDEMASPRLPVRRAGESTPKGSAKKKTASFNGVLSSMLRHRRQEQQENSSSPKKSEPNSPGVK